MQFWLVLSRFAFWTHGATRASWIFAGGDAHCVVKPSPVRGFWGRAMLWVSSSAGSASSRSPARPTGRRDAGVVWAEGLHSGWKARMSGVGIAPGPSGAPAGRPHEVLLLVFAIHAPPFLGGRGRAMGPAATYVRIPKGCGADG